MPRCDPNNKVILFAPGLYTFTQVAGTELRLGSAGARLFLNVTSVSAGASLQVGLEMVDPLSNFGLSLGSWTFPTVTAPGTWELTIYPGIQTQAQQAVNDCLIGGLLVTAAVNGNAPQVQFSLCAVPIW